MRNGHDASDRALQYVAGLLGQNTRSSDHLFRNGGEEFIIVLVAAKQRGRDQVVIADGPLPTPPERRALA